MLKYVKRLLFSVFVGMVIVLVFLGSFVLADKAAHVGRIHQGVRMYGVSISHLNKAQAKAKLEPKIKTALSQALILKNGETQWTVEPADLKASADLSKALEEAYQKGRTGGLITQLKKRLSLWISPETVYVESQIKVDFLDSFVKRIVQETNRPPQDARLEIEGREVNLVKAKPGRRVRTSLLASLIKKRLADFGDRTLSVPNKIIPVDIRDADALAARKSVIKMISAPITLTLSDKSEKNDPNGKTFEIPQVKIGTLIDFNKIKKGRRARLVAVLSREKIDRYFAPMRETVEIKPVDAQFEAAGGVVTIIPSQNGTAIDIDALHHEVTRLVNSKAPRRGVIKLKAALPERTTEKAQAMGIKERVSTHTEYFDYTPNRSRNIGLMADELDGKIVAPGEVFSLNKATGPRTPAKGYLEAPVIVNGQLSPDVGGGVCNVSSAFFNTVFFGGYPVVERWPHDFYIAHYPAGRDASIYYDGGMDFRFKNDTPHYILIKTAHTDSSVTISFYSTNMGTEVSYNDTGFVNIVPFGITYKDDPTLPTGFEKEGDMGYGMEGREITVYRTVKRGGKVILQDKFFSHYEPKNRVMLKGTGPALPPGAPPPPGATPMAPAPPAPPP
ncbi:MAG: VanW family protein [Actinomycetota bacterium]